MRNWQNGVAHVESTHHTDMTNYPKWKDGSVAVQSPSRSLRNRDRDQLLNLAMELVPGWWSWTESQENHIDDIGDSTNVLLKQDRNKQCPRLPVQRLRYHINSVSGPTSNQVSTTKAVSKCQKRWSDCFGTILQYFVKKTEQSNSESRHRCFIQNFSLLSIGLFEHGWISCNKGGVPKKRFQHCVDPFHADTIIYLRAI